MTESDKALYASLMGSDNLELLPGGQSSVSKSLGASLSAIKGNPPFKGEVALQISVKYYSQGVAGTPVDTAPSALPTALKTQYPVYFFGKGDLRANYAKASSLVNLAAWDEDKMSVIVGGQNAQSVIYPDSANPTTPYAIGSVVNNRLAKGDVLLVIPMSGFTAGASATTVIAEVLIHCNNVAYSTMIDALASDILGINMIRYTVDPSQTSQLNNQIEIIKQSPLGKTSSDSLDPNTYITGQTFNNNISDIPINLPVDKNLGLATLVNYDVVSFTWTVTFLYVNKFAGK